MFDVNQSPTNNYGSCTPGNGGFSIPKNYLSNPDVAGGEVLVRPGSVGTRYAGMIPTEQMHTTLAAPMQAKKYWLDFYSAATYCIVQYSSTLCIRLVEAGYPSNYFTVNNSFVINDQTATGEWNYYGMCVDLQTPNVSGFDRLSVQNIGPDIAAYDDFRLLS